MILKKKILENIKNKNCNQKFIDLSKKVRTFGAQWKGFRCFFDDGSNFFSYVFLTWNEFFCIKKKKKPTCSTHKKIKQKISMNSYWWFWWLSFESWFWLMMMMCFQQQFLIFVLHLLLLFLVTKRDDATSRSGKLEYYNYY